jgi:UDP-GlcNAc:undecaprenyl-phosphate GlcNAc-1-phosphate transferase
MHALFILGTSAFLLCLVITPICRDIFIRAGLVDRPDTERKFHVRAVPRVGGIPIAISYAAALGLVLLFNPGGNVLYIQHKQVFHALLPAAAIIFATGLLDDLIGLRPRYKLLGQLIAAVVAVSLGAHLVTPHLAPWLAKVISVFWLVGCANAVNLIDGMDGLATGVGLLATITTLLVAVLSGNFGLALATVPLAGCLLAFLRYNFSPASVFLGDCGSLTIGFVLGCFGLIWSQRTGTMLGMVAPLMALALPLIDVGLAIGRRFLRSVPIFKGDRGHIHHRVLALGFSTRTAALMLYAVCGLAATFAILESFSVRSFRWPILVIFCSLALIGIDRLGYIEFAAARKTLSHTFMRRAVQEHIQVEELQRALADANSIEQWWAVVRKTCNELAFASMHVELHGYSFEEQFVVSNKNPSCRIHLDLADDGFMVLTRIPEKSVPRNMMIVLHQIQSSVEQKAPPLAMSKPASKASVESTVVSSSAA